MKNLSILLLVGILSLTNILAQGQKIIIKSIETTTNHVFIDMNGLVEVHTWDEDFIRVTSFIEMGNFDNQTFSRLVAVKRYAISAQNEGNALKIQMPNLFNQVIIKGEMLKDVIKYDIFLPKGVSFEIIGGHTCIYR